ncbi:MAG: YjjG family noncanonical pyrimidine nucleotidase [Chitinophagaceae bacterium]|nr:YjjG family noncanonical pyrimidine nucleotidase [Chitinophagaceae bacterium]
MNNKYKHIFFDLDHTLWDFDLNSANTLKRVYNELQLEQQGVTDFDDFLLKYNDHNQLQWDRFRKGLIRREELRWKRFWLTLLDYKINNTNLAHEMSSAYLEILPLQTELMPHAKEMLDHCNGRYTMHLITNGFDLTQRMKLQFSGISNYFTEIITSERGHSMKPHPGIFEYALKATGAAIEESIMVGDALEVDIIGAKNAGWDQVYFNPARIAHTEKPTYEVACLSELKGIF